MILVLSALTIAYSIGSAQQNYPLSQEALELGITEYTVKHNKDVTTVYFNHIEKRKDGKLEIRSELTDYSILLNLSQENGQVVSISWRPVQGEFILKDNKSRSAHFIFSEKAWVADSVDSMKILDMYTDSIKIAGAIFADTDSMNKNETNSQPVDKSTLCSEEPTESLASWPCDYGTQVRGSCNKTTRSESCRCATSQVNRNCWNLWCTGCCEYVDADCDCACLVEDYFCACGRGGFPCSGPSR